MLRIIIIVIIIIAVVNNNITMMIARRMSVSCTLHIDHRVDTVTRHSKN